MKLAKVLTLSGFALVMLGCSAAGVSYTSDPMQKLADGYELMNQGRAIPAETLGKEALLSFQESGDQYGLAETHIFFGQLYKHRAYRDAAEYYTKYNEYDPTNEKSITHTRKAIDIYVVIGNYTQAEKGKFALANAYLKNDKNMACNLYEDSIISLKKGSVENPGETFYFNPNFASAEDMISSFKTRYCANNS